MNDQELYHVVRRRVDDEVRQCLRFFKFHETRQIHSSLNTKISLALSNTKSSNYGCIACWAIKKDLKNNNKLFPNRY